METMTKVSYDDTHNEGDAQQGPQQIQQQGSSSQATCPTTSIDQGKGQHEIGGGGCWKIPTKIPVYFCWGQPNLGALGLQSCKPPPPPPPPGASFSPCPSEKQFASCALLSKWYQSFWHRILSLEISLQIADRESKELHSSRPCRESKELHSSKHGLFDGNPPLQEINFKVSNASLDCNEPFACELISTKKEDKHCGEGNEASGPHHSLTSWLIAHDP
ncbi:hypothetical protein GOP47_0023227 [Adiantum capillus-veneris]|uniref:Uncharacterized protein n=1 Tax=Adiantum capillus-veneris TaxID=13818 RepID=A0A9D4U7Z5_ADICA|nr:hypothetical protein GOP47_0023227 [Adiantum capillus-veneris]